MRIPFRDALAHSRHPGAKWPARGPACRLEPEAWPLVTPKFRIAPGQKVFSIGSCFARNIEQHLKLLGFEVPTAGYQAPGVDALGRFGNSVLNKYTPPAIHDELVWAAEWLGGARSEEHLGRFLFDVGGGRCIDLDLAGKYPEVERAQALERRAGIAALYEHAFSADVVVITFGLLEAWWDDERGAYIQETPTPRMEKLAPGRWQFETLGFEQCLDFARRSIELLERTGRPGKKILITTSPVPLARSFSGQDVVIANTYGKSVLRAVCGELCARYDSVDYFPSYESVMLTRGASVWEDDLVHVETEFVGKIVDRVIAAYVESEPQPGGERALAERAEAVEAARVSEQVLRGGRPSSARVRETLGKHVRIGVAGCSDEAIEYGPLELSQARQFAAYLSKEAGTPDAEVSLEIRDSATRAVAFEASTTLQADSPPRWRVALPTAPARALVSLRFRARDEAFNGKRWVMVRHPRFINLG